MFRKIKHILFIITTDSYHKFTTIITIIISIVGALVGKYDSDFPMFSFCICILIMFILLQFFASLLNEYSKAIAEKERLISGMSLRKNDEITACHMTMDYEKTNEVESYNKYRFKINTIEKVKKPIQVRLFNKMLITIKSNEKDIVPQNYNGLNEYFLSDVVSETEVTNIYNFEIDIKIPREYRGKSFDLQVNIVVDSIEHSFYYYVEGQR